MHGLIQPLGMLTAIPGNAFGLRGPLLKAKISWPLGTTWDLEALQVFLTDQAGLPAEESATYIADGLTIFVVLKIIQALEKKEQTPVMQAGVCTEQLPPTGTQQTYCIAVPYFHLKFTSTLIQWLLYGINRTANHLKMHAVPSNAQEKDAMMASARQLLRKAIGGGVNNNRIVTAAVELNLPLRWLNSRLLQVGSGRHARVFQSTLTEFTPAIGVGLARSKFEAAHILRLHGIPVTSHHLVGTEADAVAAANTLGYPVVIKPEDSDGGRGVYCGLVHESQVKQYFSKARQISNRILVEKHVEGLDFRITIAHGKMVKAIGRIPGGVLGDGIHSIAALLQERSRKADSRAALPMDEEALQLMREKGYDPESVLRADEFLPLRRRANMSSGGTSYDVREQIHSDNVALAVRAAEALCLDIAGIDFLTPDIAKSWIHSGAVICEVNAQPQISKEFAPNVYHDLLQQAVQAPVRLRTALLLLTDPSVDPEDHITEAVTALMGQGEQVLSVRSSGLWLDHTQIGQADSNIFSMAEGAELNRHATAVVAALPVQTIQERGLPWLFIDHACLLMDAHDSAKLEQQLGQLHALMAPHTLRPWSVKNQHSFGHSENLSNEWLAAAAPDGSGVPSTGWLSCT